MNNKMLSLDDLNENFRFIVLEVTKQLEETLKVLEHPNDKSIESIRTRDDYIDNLKSTIENKCFSRILNNPDADKKVVSLMRAVNIISNNLEKIGDYAVNIVGQMQYFSDLVILQEYNYKAFFEEILKALTSIVDALTKRDTSMALGICKSEIELDKLYDSNFKNILKALSEGKDIGNLITTLFIFQYLERAGDALLNIGEAIIFAIIGEKLKIHQYHALEETLNSPEIDTSLSDFEMDSIWEGRSGCRIGRIYNDNSQEVIFKEGNIDKLLKEKENLETWNNLLPGLPPRVINFQKNGQK
ncbi:MAG TPA: phosphate uptake regulator PhoU, partial [Spirochaetes bacterium]|nr:phosphate uptake regulator PhoU [Spirochaetota bacterium]